MNEVSADILEARIGRAWETIRHYLCRGTFEHVMIGRRKVANITEEDIQKLIKLCYGRKSNGRSKKEATNG